MAIGTADDVVSFGLSFLCVETIHAQRFASRKAVHRNNRASLHSAAGYLIECASAVRSFVHLQMH